MHICLSSQTILKSFSKSWVLTRTPKLLRTLKGTLYPWNGVFLQYKKNGDNDWKRCRWAWGIMLKNILAKFIELEGPWGGFSTPLSRSRKPKTTLGPKRSGSKSRSRSGSCQNVPFLAVTANLRKMKLKNFIFKVNLWPLTNDPLT